MLKKLSLKSKVMNFSHQKNSCVPSGGIPAEELMGDIDETKFEEIIMETKKDNANTSMFYSTQSSAVYAEELMEDVEENRLLDRFSSENNCEGPIPAEDLMVDAEDNLSSDNKYQGSIRAEDLMADAEDRLSSENSYGGPIPVEELMMANVGETIFRRNGCEKMNGETRSSGGAVYAEELMDDVNSVDSVVHDDLPCSKSTENTVNSGDQLSFGENILSNFKRINGGTPLEHFAERLSRVLYLVIEIEPNASFGRLMTQSMLFYKRLWMFHKEESFFKLPKMDKVWRLLEYSRLRNNEDLHMIMTHLSARYRYLAALEFAVDVDVNSNFNMLFRGQQAVNAIDERSYLSNPTYENEWNTTMGAPGSVASIHTNEFFSLAGIPCLENRSALEYSAIQPMPTFSRSCNEITGNKLGKKDDRVHLGKRIFAKTWTKDDRVAEKVQRSEKKLKKDKELSEKKRRNV